MLPLNSSKAPHSCAVLCLVLFQGPNCLSGQLVPGPDAGSVTDTDGGPEDSGIQGGDGGPEGGPLCAPNPESDPGADVCPEQFPVCCDCVAPSDFAIETRCFVKAASRPTTTAGIPCYSLGDCTERAPEGQTSTCTSDGSSCPSASPFCCSRTVFDSELVKRACSDHALVGWQCALDAGSCPCPPPPDAGTDAGG
jgi:hypothetical protein